MRAWIASCVALAVAGASASAQLPVAYPNAPTYWQPQPYWQPMQAPAYHYPQMRAPAYYYPQVQAPPRAYYPQPRAYHPQAAIGPLTYGGQPVTPPTIPKRLHAPHEAPTSIERLPNKGSAVPEKIKATAHEGVEDTTFDPWTPDDHWNDWSPAQNEMEPEERKPFASDRSFPNFIGPISNPINAKDPRALTEARFLHVYNWLPGDHAAFGGGDFQLYALQLRLAVTDRLSIIADKDGYLDVQPDVGPNRNGFVNVAAGAKYALVRDVENQLLVTPGFMFEPQSGDGDVFSNEGDGVFTVFTTIGKEFCGKTHFIFNTGFQFPIDNSQNSRYLFVSAHVDKQLWGCLYPLLELNWFHWTDGGNRGLPSQVGEGDGLLNLGTNGAAGNDLVTVAAGLKAIVGCHLDLGIAYETPISNREDLIGHRFLFEAILRY